MTTFIAICALFLAAATFLLVWPLLGSRRKGEGTPPAYVAAIVVVALLPIAAFSIYLQASNWDWRAPEPTKAVAAHDLKQVVAQLQEQLASKPDDIEGWKLLGRSATVMGDYGLARTAFGEANTRSQGRDVEAIVGYAESLVLNDEREIDGQAADLFERALAMEPDNSRALWYGGIAAYRRGDHALAQQRWVELQNHELPPELRQVLAQRLAELEQSLGKPVARAAAPIAAGGATTGGGAAGEAAAGAIEITVGIAPGLASRVPPDATIFVIARRGSGGPPLAVQRHAAGTWPISVHLSDADAMLPGTSLAAGGPLTLIARISKSGQPIAASGDLFGEVGYDFASAHPASITIDRIVP